MSEPALCCGYAALLSSFLMLEQVPWAMSDCVLRSRSCFWATPLQAAEISPPWIPQLVVGWVDLIRRIRQSAFEKLHINGAREVELYDMIRSTITRTLCTRTRRILAELGSKLSPRLKIELSEITKVKRYNYSPNFPLRWIL